MASTAVVTAIGCDEDGWRRMSGPGVVDTESYDSWPAFLRRVRARGAAGVQLVTSDAHEGLRRAIEEVFQGAAWQRCVVHLMRDCARAASGSRSPWRRVSRVVAPVFRLRDAGAAGAAHHLAVETLESCRGDAARILGGSRARRAGIPRLPGLALEAPAYRQRPGAGERGDKAQVARGAGPPVGRLPREAGGGRSRATWTRGGGTLCFVKTT